MHLTEHKPELAQLALLMALDAVFYFAVIPAGIVDPEGFGMDEGLPPSFSARLVAALAALLMLGRAARLVLMGASTPASGDEAGESGGGEPVAITERSLLAIGATLVFALVLVPQLGFFVAGALLMPCLLLVMGEIRISRLVLYPAGVLALVWLLFERLLSVRLPPGALFGG